jgi:hypothetical protein
METFLALASPNTKSNMEIFNLGTPRSEIQSHSLTTLQPARISLTQFKQVLETHYLKA